MVKLPPLNIATAIYRIAAIVSKCVVQDKYELGLLSTYTLYSHPNCMLVKRETVSWV